MPNYHQKKIAMINDLSGYGRVAGLLGVPVGGGPPARSPHASFRLGVIDLEARPGPAAAHGHRSQANVAIVHPAISHAIPLGLFQDLNWHRWNCNDSGGC